MTARKTITALIAAVALAWPAVSSAATWSVPEEFSTIQEAIDSPEVQPGDEILVGPGYYRGAHVTKSVQLKGSAGTIISTGPEPWPHRDFTSGFLFRGPKAENGSGSSIVGFTFQGVDFPIFASEAGAVIDFVTVRDNVIRDAIQGITLWHADSWIVRNNRILGLRTARGGGVGIVIGSYSGDDAFENEIVGNEILGTVHVGMGETGNYNAAGIFLVSDHRGKRTGGLVEGNLVAANRISLRSDNPALIPVVPIEVSDTRSADPTPDVTDNEIVNNET